MKYKVYDIVDENYMDSTDVYITLDGELKPYEHIDFGEREFNISEYFILEYTGFKDKNGEELYNHDRVRFKNPKQPNVEYLDCPVEYNNYSWMCGNCYLKDVKDLELVSHWRK